MEPFEYDRYGNRTIDAAATFNAPEPQFDNSQMAAQNRLYSPTENFSDNCASPTTTTRLMCYDASGNLIRDKHVTNAGWIKYDGEGRQAKHSVADNESDSTLYYYDGDGKRRQMFSGQLGGRRYIYGLGGELIYETTEDGERKEYGYRNGQLLIVATPKKPNDPNVKWLVSDHLGTPRIVVDKTGNLSAIKRHDYLPFGEEIGSTIGGRSTGQGYGNPQSDGVRQQFTGYERDLESGLDFAQARYMGSSLGRFTSPDPLTASASLGRPQSWNRYTYSYNNPYKFTDPSGMIPADYYSEDGKFLGSDGNEADKNSYIVTGTEKDNKNTKLDPSIAIATLPSLGERTAIADTGSRSQKPSNYYKGKESSKNDPYGNFHEEAVVIGKDATGKTQIINTAPGAVYADGDTSATAPHAVASNQNQQAALDTMIRDGKVDILAHSHPEGGVFPPPKPGSIMMSGTAVTYGQPPSTVDVGGANGAKTFIVVSTEKNRAYFYGRNGLQAQFPLDKFRKVGK